MYVYNQQGQKRKKNVTLVEGDQDISNMNSNMSISNKPVEQTISPQKTSKKSKSAVNVSANISYQQS